MNSRIDSYQDDVVSKPFRIVDLIPKVEELTARYPYPIKAATRS